MKWVVILKLDCEGAARKGQRSANCTGALYGAEHGSFEVARAELLKRARANGWEVDEVADTARCNACCRMQRLTRYLQGKAKVKA